MTENNEQASITKSTRIPNAQRSAQTRSKLIEATIDCLHQFGYHQTTTTMVAKRACVSRGAMLHHFPTKADLMIAVAEEMTVMRGQLHRSKLAKLESPKEVFLRLVDVLWEAMLSPSGIARIELVLSTRSDPELADRFEEINDDLDRRHKERVWQLAQDMGLRTEHHKTKVFAFVQLYAACLRGLAIDSLRKGSRVGASDSVELLKEFQKQMLASLLKEI